MVVYRSNKKTPPKRSNILKTFDLLVSTNTEKCRLHYINLRVCPISVQTYVKGVFTSAVAPSIDCNMATSSYAVLLLRR